jgi:hypothetical protein
LLFTVTGGSFTVCSAWARAETLSNPVTPPPHLGLAFGVLAEPSGICSSFDARTLPLLELRPLLWAHLPMSP